MVDLKGKNIYVLTNVEMGWIVKMILTVLNQEVGMKK
jgi:hypothetical protein